MILLCYRHHIETNDVGEYDVTVMRKIKADHEARVKDLPYEPSDDAVASITREADEYWREVRRRNRDESALPDDIRMEIDVDADIASLFSTIRESLAGLEILHESLRRSGELLSQDVRAALDSLGYELQSWDDLPYWRNPTVSRDWEALTLGLSNFLTRLTVLIDQLEIRHFETALALSPDSVELRGKLEELRRRVLEYAAHLGYVD